MHNELSGESARDDEFAPPGRWLSLGARGSIWIREDPRRSAGRPVVLLHGLGATAGLNWARAFSHLDQGLRPIGVDHRGHGRGIRTPNFRLEDCADDVAATIDGLGLGCPLVVGYSMGGPIASLLWRRHPELVRGLILCATAGKFDGGATRRLALQWAKALGSLPMIVPRAVTRVNQWWGPVMSRMTSSQSASRRRLRWAISELSGHDPRSILQAAASLTTYEGHRWTRKIDVPTTVIATADDRLVPLASQVHLAHDIPDARLQTVPGGHLSIASRADVEFLNTLDSACTDMSTLAA